MERKRIDWIDFAKGLAIMLVIIGHCVHEGKIGATLQGFIYSFHMPLFFILSCTTYSYSKNSIDYKNKIVKSAKHLLFPVLLIFTFQIIIQCILDTSKIYNVYFWTDKFYTLLYSSAPDLSILGGWKTIVGIGTSWFFIVLFWGRSIFDYIHMKINDDSILMLFSLIIGTIGVIAGTIGRILDNVYFGIFSSDIALACMPFFYFGYYLKNHPLRDETIKKMLIWFIIWVFTLLIQFHDYNNITFLVLGDRKYYFFPLCYLTAIAGMLFISYFSVLCCKLKKLSVPITIIGKNSLYLLCVHILDYLWQDKYYVVGHQFYTALKRLGIDLAISIAIICCKCIINQIIMMNKIKR